MVIDGDKIVDSLVLKLLRFLELLRAVLIHVILFGGLRNITQILASGTEMLGASADDYVW